MANFDLMPNGDAVPDKRVIGRTTSSTNAATTGTLANYGNIATMRTRLAAINGAYYTAARLNQMSFSDMVYAIRVNDDAAGL